MTARLSPIHSLTSWRSTRWLPTTAIRLTNLRRRAIGLSRRNSLTARTVCIRSTRIGLPVTKAAIRSRIHLAHAIRSIARHLRDTKRTSTRRRRRISVSRVVVMKPDRLSERRPRQQPPKQKKRYKSFKHHDHHPATRRQTSPRRQRPAATTQRPRHQANSGTPPVPSTRSSPPYQSPKRIHHAPR